MQLKQVVPSNLPSWAKGFVAVVGTSAAVGIGYAFYSNYKRKKDEAEALKQASAAGKELLNLAKSGIRPSISETQALGMASRLVTAISGCGTDEEAVYSVFRNLANAADLYLLIKAFGIRYYVPCAADSPISYARYMFDEKTFGGDLGTFIGYDMTAAEIDKINAILAAKKINYKF